MLAALHIALTLAAVVLLGRLGARLLGRLAALTPSTRDDAFFRLLGYAWWGVVAVAGASYLSHALSLPYEPLATWGRSLVAWLGGKGVAGGAVLLATWTAYRLVPLLLRSLPLPETEGELTRQAVRAKTLRNVSESALKVAVVTVGGLLFLSNLGLNGAGVAGLAVSFAAQNLIRDFIHGFFILLEDQYGVGDIVKVGDLAGVVEKFNLRLTVLRDLEGKAHFIPNSQIQQVTVFTQEWSRAVVDVGVAYKEDVDRVLAIFRDEAERFFQDPEWQDKLTNPPEVRGVEDLADSAVVIRTLFGTKPAQQWAVAREFRRRIKKRLDQEGVEIPFPHRTLYFGEPLRVVKETP